MSIESRLRALEGAFNQEDEPWPGAPLMVDHLLDGDVYHIPNPTEHPTEHPTEYRAATPAEFEEWHKTLAPGRIVVIVNQPKRESKE